MLERIIPEKKFKRYHQEDHDLQQDFEGIIDDQTLWSRLDNQEYTRQVNALDMV